MKLLKKLVSLACAVGILATVAVSAVPVSAAEYTRPTFEISLKSYNEETGVGQVAVSVHGLSTVFVGDYASWLPANIRTDIAFGDPDAFDQDLYQRTTVRQNVVINPEYSMSFSQGPYQAANGYMRVTTAGLGSVDQALSGDMSEYYTINFKINEGYRDQENTITFKDAWYGIYDGVDTVNSVWLKYTEGDVDIVGCDFGESGEPVIVIPPATGVTATGGQLLNLKPSDIGLEGDEWTTEDPAYADEKAVVSLANVKKDDAITGFTWEIKATDAEGNPLEKTTEYFKAGNIESAAEVTVGLVVGYDTTEWQSVEIVGVTAE